MTKPKIAEPTNNDLVLYGSVDDAVRAMIASEVSAEDIAMRYLSAENVDDLLGESSVIGLADMLDTPFTIESARIFESSYEAGLSGFVVMEGSLDDGSKVAISSGATSVVAQVVTMHARGWLPIRVMGKQSTRPTKAGYYVISLVKAPESF